MMYYLIILCVIICIILAKGVKALTEKMTVLNIRMSVEEKEEYNIKCSVCGSMRCIYRIWRFDQFVC